SCSASGTYMLLRQRSAPRELNSPLVQIAGLQPLAGKPVVGVHFRTHGLNPCFSHGHVFASSFRRVSVPGASRGDATKTRTGDFRETSRLLSSLDQCPQSPKPNNLTFEVDLV